MIANLGLAVAAGIVKAPSDDEIVEMPEPMAAMIREATAFLRAGGALAWGDWSRMDRAERACFLEAGRIVTAEHAFQIGLASQGRGEAIAVGAEADGGETLKALSMDAALESVVGKAMRGGTG